jgi:hypothetical protein
MGHQDAGQRKRHSSDEEDRDPGERRQRQRKTGFDGPSSAGAGEQPPARQAELTPAQIGAQLPCPREAWRSMRALFHSALASSSLTQIGGCVYSCGSK